MEEKNTPTLLHDSKQEYNSPNSDRTALPSYCDFKGISGFFSIGDEKNKNDPKTNKEFLILDENNDTPDSKKDIKHEKSLCCIIQKDVPEEEKTDLETFVTRQLENLYRAAGAGMIISIKPDTFLYETLTEKNLEKLSPYQKELCRQFSQLHVFLKDRAEIASNFTTIQNAQSFMRSQWKKIKDNPQKDSKGSKDFFSRALSKVMGQTNPFDDNEVEKFIDDNSKNINQFYAGYTHFDFFQRPFIPTLCQMAYWEGLCLGNYNIYNRYVAEIKNLHQTFTPLEDQDNLILNSKVPQAGYLAQTFHNAYKLVTPDSIKEMRQIEMQNLAQQGLQSEYNMDGIHCKGWNLENHWLETELQKKERINQKTLIDYQRNVWWKLVLKTIPYAVFTLTVFAVVFVTFFALLALQNTQLYKVLEFFGFLGQLIIPGLGAYIVNKIRERIFPPVETHLEMTFSQIEDIENIILPNHKLKPAHELTMQEKQKLLGFLKAHIGLLTKESQTIRGWDISHYPNKGFLDNLQVMVILLELEQEKRLHNGDLDISKQDIEQDIATQFVMAYEKLPNIINKLKYSEVSPKTSSFGLSINIVLLTFSLFVAAVFALAMGNVQGFTDRIITGMLLTFYPLGANSESILSFVSNLLTPTLAGMGFLSLLGVTYFAGAVARSLSFNNYENFKRNHQNEIEKMKAHNFKAYNLDSAPSDSFFKSTLWQRVSSGFISGLTFGFIKRNELGKFTFPSDYGRPLLKAFIHAGIGAGIILLLIAGPIGAFFPVGSLGILFTVLTVYALGVLINTFLSALGFQNHHLTLSLKSWQGTKQEISDFARIHTLDYSLGLLDFDPAKAKEGNSPTLLIKTITYLSGISGFGAICAGVFLILVSSSPLGFILLGTGAALACLGLFTLTRYHPGWKFRLGLNGILLDYTSMILIFTGLGLLISGAPLVTIVIPLLVVGGFFLLARLGVFDAIGAKIGVEVKVGVSEDRPEHKIKNLRNLIKLAIFGTSLLLLVVLAPQVGLIGLGVEVSAGLLFITYAFMGIIMPLFRHFYARLDAPYDGVIQLTYEKELSVSSKNIPDSSRNKSFRGKIERRDSESENGANSSNAKLAAQTGIFAPGRVPLSSGVTTSQLTTLVSDCGTGLGT